MCNTINNLIDKHKTRQKQATKHRLTLTSHRKNEQNLLGEESSN